MRYATLFIGCLLFAALVVQSCSVQKRKHLPGWHVTSKKMDRGRSTSSLDKSTTSIQDSKLMSHKLQQENDGDATTSKKLPNEFFIDSLTPELDVGQVEEVHPERAELEVGTQAIPTMNKVRFRPRDQLPDKKEKKPWLPKLLGGILGVLLALALLVPVFIFLIVLFDESLTAVPRFEVEEDDSFFIRGFKKSFNGVMSVGVIALLWILLIASAFLIVLILYAEFGIIGAILGLIFLVLVVLIAAYLVRKLFDILFPRS